MKLNQAYRFALDPSPGQEAALASHAGAARFAWNWGLAKCKARYEAGGKWYSAIDLHKLWNWVKKADLGLTWWGENSKCAYQEAFRDLDRALRDFLRSRKGERKGRRLGFPADNTGNVLAMDGPKALRVSMRRLRHASRAHSGKAKGSANRRKSAARLARVHARVASVRADAIHKATTDLARQHETIVAEDLNVAGMLRNRRLARATADAGFGQAVRMLGYKTAWNGGQLVRAARFYPSSKTCSGCGAVKAKLALSERTYVCTACGLVLDRDVNAAVNLLKLAASGAESINACGGDVRPGLAGRLPLKQEPGTALADQTGTAAGQLAAAGQELTNAY